MTTMNTFKKLAAAMVLVVMATGCAFAAPAPKPAKDHDRPAAHKSVKKAPAHKDAPRAKAPAPAPKVAAAPAPAPMVAPAPAPTTVVVERHDKLDAVDALLLGAGISIGNALTDAVTGD